MALTGNGGAGCEPPLIRRNLMPNKKSKMESGKVVLARVKKEMAEPRLSRSVRQLNLQDHRKGRKAHV